MAAGSQRATQLQDHKLPFKIGPAVGKRIDQGIAHTGLRGKVDDPIHIGVTVPQGQHSLPFGDVKGMEMEPWFRRNPSESCPLQGRIVIIVHIVHTNHLFSTRQQGHAGVVPYESGRAGDKNGHSVRAFVIL